MLGQVEMSYSSHLGASISEHRNPLKRTFSYFGSSGKVEVAVSPGPEMCPHSTFMTS